MGKKKYRKYKTVTPDVVANLQKIDNLWRRACACCHLGIIGETEAAKDLLRSCHGTDPFFDALISRSLDIQALPLSQPRKPWRRKPWQAPNRLPSLFTTENGENTWLQTAVEEPVVSMAPEQLHWAAEAAQATLSADLIDLVIDSSGEVSIFADLIDMSEEAKAKLLEEWKPITKPSFPEPSGNLFRAFGIELPAAGGCDCHFPEIKARKRAKARDVVILPSLFVTLQGEKEKP